MKILVIIIAFWTNAFVFGQESLKLTFQPVISQNDSIELQLFKGYISHVRLLFNDGSIYEAVPLAYLLDFLDSTQNSIPLEIPENKTITGISYMIGTDSLTNISGVYDGDLDPILGMYWAWNSGYINWKIEGEFNDQRFEYHIGGYTFPYATAREVTHQLDSALKEYVIAIDVPSLLTNANQLHIPEMVMIPGENAHTLADLLQPCFQFNE